MTSLGIPGGIITVKYSGSSEPKISLKLAHENSHPLHGSEQLHIPSMEQKHSAETKTHTKGCLRASNMHAERFKGQLQSGYELKRENAPRVKGLNKVAHGDRHRGITQEKIRR